MTEPTVLAGGQGETFSLGPITVRVLADTAAYGLAEGEFVAGEAGPPLHSHRWEEAFYVISGKLEVTVGSEVIIAWPGDYVSIPADAAHTFAAHGDEPARFVGVFGSRAGLAYLRELSDAMPDDVLMAAARGRHGVRLE